jgi:hypothetical protein
MLEQQVNRRAMPGPGCRPPWVTMMPAGFCSGTTAVLPLSIGAPAYNEGDVSTEEKRTMNVLFGGAKQAADKTFAYLA